MFDRFTDRARKSMGLARQEAQRYNHDYIGTEHMLLGLLQIEAGAAASVLKEVGLQPKTVREEVERLVATGKSNVTVGSLPFTPRGKRALELSLEEANKLGHTCIGTEHLLLGLIRENEGIAAQVLRNLNLKVEDVRRTGASQSEPESRRRPQGGARTPRG
jgi:ATP-dependent Clp protease ATP-binding subunit ClpC